MPETLLLTAGRHTATITCCDTPTAQAICAALPIQSEVHTWGQEIYFGVPIEAVLEADARDVVEAGEIAFWVEGRCIAVGFGPTPISRGDEIRLAAAVNVWGHADDVHGFAACAPGDPVRLRRA